MTIDILSDLHLDFYFNNNLELSSEAVKSIFEHEHINKASHDEKSNTFFTFNGHKLIEDGSMKYWVYGHTHDK
jgi:DNA repair exonuclease SbcCD nuclease subunit